MDFSKTSVIRLIDPCMLLATMFDVALVEFLALAEFLAEVACVLAFEFLFDNRPEKELMPLVGTDRVSSSSAANLRFLELVTEINEGLQEGLRECATIYPSPATALPTLLALPPPFSFSFAMLSSSP